MTVVSTREDWIETARGRLFSQRWTPAGGSGQAPIVLFHDSLGCVALWREFPAQLAQATGREVIAYDRLGFGRSDPYPGLLPSSFILDEAHEGFSALRAQLGLTRFVAFGHSVGGAMAVACAAQFPDACTALVTESAQAFVEDLTLAGIRDAQRDFADDSQRQRLRKYHGDKAEWVLHAWIDTWLSEGFRGWNLDAELARLRCPLLSLHGELDEFGSAHHPQRLVTLSGGPARMRLLPGCGHVPHRQLADAVLHDVGAFLRGEG